MKISSTEESAFSAKNVDSDFSSANRSRWRDLSCSICGVVLEVKDRRCGMSGSSADKCDSSADAVFCADTRELIDAVTSAVFTVRQIA